VSGEDSPKEQVGTEVTVTVLIETKVPRVLLFLFSELIQQGVERGAVIYHEGPEIDRSELLFRLCSLIGERFPSGLLFL
jgi:hypothetical protein|tara:strand:+ start:10691 stop:10927 length:237 start_codon:yes stop_codon:yes gene_type:complete